MLLLLFVRAWGGPLDAIEGTTLGARGVELQADLSWTEIPAVTVPLNVGIALAPRIDLLMSGGWGADGEAPVVGAKWQVLQGVAVAPALDVVDGSAAAFLATTTQSRRVALHTEVGTAVDLAGAFTSGAGVAVVGWPEGWLQPAVELRTAQNEGWSLRAAATVPIGDAFGIHGSATWPLDAGVVVSVGAAVSLERPRRADSRGAIAGDRSPRRSMIAVSPTGVQSSDPLGAVGPGVAVPRDGEQARDRQH